MITELTSSQTADCYSLLLDNPKFAYAMLGRFYSFKEYQLIQHKQLMNWWGVSSNENINWKEINWRLFADKLLHCEEGQEEYDDNYIECNQNKTIPWKELIDQWQGKVNWCFLAQNETIMQNTGLVNQYRACLEPHRALIAGRRVEVDMLDIVAMQRERFPNRINLIWQIPFTEKDLINNMEMLWQDLFCEMVNDEVIDRNFSVICSSAKVV